MTSQIILQIYAWPPLLGWPLNGKGPEGCNPQAPLKEFDGLRAFRLTFPHLEFRIKCRKLRRLPRRPKMRGSAPSGARTNVRQKTEAHGFSLQ